MKKAGYFIYFLLVSFVGSAQLTNYKIVFCGPESRGYYFISDVKGAFILDKNGNTIYHRPGIQALNFSLQPNGLMSYFSSDKFFLVDSTFTVIDSVSCKGIPISNFHELQILHNGHFLILGTDSVRIKLHPYNYSGGRTGDSITIQYSILQEQDEHKNVVFQWKTNEHYELDDVDTFFFRTSPSRSEWIHSNSIEMDVDGNILLSNRNFNEITKINRSNGSIMWRFGGKHNQFKFVNCPVPFYGQHDVRRIKNGHLTLFDAGYYATPHGARALEFELDEKKKIATLKWSYMFDTSVVSSRQGNVQRLDNSNTLINYGYAINNDLSFVVVDSIGKKIFQLNGAHPYRVLNYLTLPWRLNRPVITCFDSVGTTYLDAGPGFSRYRWTNGDLSRIIKAPDDEMVTVIVPCANGGFMNAEPYIKPKGPTGCNNANSKK